MPANTRLALLAGLALATMPIRAEDQPAQPSSVDLRPTIEAWGLGARAQGARGTCSVFALTGAIEFAAAVHRGVGTRLSVEFLNWASNRATGAEADGGFFSDLWMGFERYGLCAEADLPYRESFDPSLKPGTEATSNALEMRNAGLELHWIKPWDVTSGLTADQLIAIKETLARGWPVCAGLRWPIRDPWNGNLLNTPGPDAVRDGHSILFVGYHDDPEAAGGGTFTLINSAGGPANEQMTYEYATLYANDVAWVSAPSDPPPPKATPAEGGVPAPTNGARALP